VSLPCQVGVAAYALGGMSSDTKRVYFVVVAATALAMVLSFSWRPFFVCYL
jgi:hypothetical protein